jgi:hypothetical protein
MLRVGTVKYLTRNRVVAIGEDVRLDYDALSRHSLDRELSAVNLGVNPFDDYALASINLWEQRLA